MSDETLARRLGMLREKRKEAQERRDENMDRYKAGAIDGIEWLQLAAELSGRMQALTYAIALFDDDADPLMVG